MSLKLKNKNIFCIGEMLFDMLQYGAVPGGAPMNVALHLNNLGIKTSFVSRIGNDNEGEKLIQFLEQSGMDIGFIQKDKQLNTSKVLVHLDKNKNATYEICFPVAWDNITLNKQLINQVRESGIMVFGSLAARSITTRKTLLTLLEQANFKVLDVNLRAPYDKRETIELLLSKADFVKLNDDELVKISAWHNIKSDNEKEIINWLTDKYNLSMVCVTRGENGAIVFDGNEYFNHPGYFVDTVDTVGAGDSFLAAFLESFVNEKSINEALDQACAIGAFVATQKGATPIIDKTKINEIVNS